MQFLILAFDAKDEGAPGRRMAARDAHLASIADYKARGHIKMGAALLDDAEKMVGSCIIAEFPTRAELDIWLDQDPYTVNNVWENIHISLCRVAPSFQLAS